MKAALYIRVSTEEQAAEGYSIDAQKKRLLAYVESMEWSLADVYIDDGYSAKDTDRPELQRLLVDAEERKIDVVVVHKLDRFSRSVKDTYFLIETLSSWGVGFQSVHERFDTTTTIGKAVMGVLSVFAQLEREMIAERVRFGMEQMVHEGKRPGGPIPYGYNEDMSVNAQEASVLRELRDYYMSGDGFKTVAQKLNQKGYRRRGGNKWSGPGVYYVLDNPFYAGKLRYGGKKPNGKYATHKKEERVDIIMADSDHTPIFTWEEYEEHTKRMKHRSFYGYTKKREYWFAGVLRCGRCGAKMTARPHRNKKKDGTYGINFIGYICASRQHGQGCNMPMFRQELVEKLVFSYIDKQRLDSEQLRAEAKQAEKQISTTEDQISTINKELKRIQERKKKWQYMLVEELISESDYRLRKNEEEQTEALLKEQLQEFVSKDIPISIDAQNLMFELHELWDEFDDKDKNEIIQTIFQSIELDTPVEKAVGRKGKFIEASIKSVVYN